MIVTEQTMDAMKSVHEGKMLKKDAVFPLLLGGVATVLCLLLVGKSSFLLAAMAVMMACFFLRYRMEEKEAAAV